jgi:hypothetical protein
MDRSEWQATRSTLKTTDRARVERALLAAYEAKGLTAPEHIIFMPSPLGFAVNDSGQWSWNTTTTSTIRSNWLFTSNSSYRDVDPFAPILTSINAAIWDYPQIISSSPDWDITEHLDTILSEAIAFIPRKKIPLVLEYPIEAHRDDEGRLHNENGPALVWKDGNRHYYIHGVRVTHRFIAKPPTMAYINDQMNTERRRILIEKFGPEKYLKVMGAQLRSEDEFGKLWVVDRTIARDMFVRRNSNDPRVQQLITPIGNWGGFEITDENEKAIRKHKGWDDNTEDICFVELVNSTPEPDGTYSRYFERVPPKTKTPKDAIAWQFRLKTKNYQPVIES